MASTTPLFRVFFLLLFATGIKAARMKRSNIVHNAPDGTDAGKPNEGMQEEIRKRLQECNAKCADSVSWDTTCVDKCMGDKADVDFGKPKSVDGKVNYEDGGMTIWAKDDNTKKLIEKKLKECQEKCSDGGPDGNVDKCMKECLGDKPNFGKPEGHDGMKEFIEKKMKECQEKCPDAGPGGSQSDCMDKCMGDAPKGDKPGGKNGRKGKKPDFRKTPKKGKQKVRRALKFNGDYDQVVGNRKAKFLQECTAKSPEGVTCTDVRKGSIIIDKTGPAEDVDKDVTAVESAGELTLPSFAVGAPVEEVEPDLGDIESSGVVVGDESQEDDQQAGSGESGDAADTGDSTTPSLALKSSSQNFRIEVSAGVLVLFLAVANMIS